MRRRKTYKVVQSSYLVEVNNEHVILDNSALLKCTIPSFVTDFVRVASWTVSDPSGSVETNLDPESSGIPHLVSFRCRHKNESAVILSIICSREIIAPHRYKNRICNFV